MKWYFEGPIEIENPETKESVTFYVDASGDISNDDFEINELSARDDNNKRVDLNGWQEELIEEALIDNDSIYEDALGRTFDTYDRREDLE